MENKNQHIEIAQLFISSDAHILRGLLEAANASHGARHYKWCLDCGYRY